MPTSPREYSFAVTIRNRLVLSLFRTYTIRAVPKHNHSDRPARVTFVCLSSSREPPAILRPRISQNHLICKCPRFRAFRDLVLILLVIFLETVELCLCQRPQTYYFEWSVRRSSESFQRLGFVCGWIQAPYASGQATPVKGMRKISDVGRAMFVQSADNLPTSANGSKTYRAQSTFSCRRPQDGTQRLAWPRATSRPPRRV